jgi:hypothetical protein
MTKGENITWEAVKGFLMDRLSKTNHIQTFGTIGSLNVENDIDVIITKKPSSFSKDFYKEMHDLFYSLNSFIKKNYSKKLVCFSRLDHQKDVLTIGDYQKGDIAFHVMSYISLPQMHDDWNQHILRSESIKRIIKEEYNILWGDKNEIFSNEFCTAKEYDSFFTYLNDCSRLNSNYPEDVLIEAMHHLFRYMKKRVGFDYDGMLENEDIIKINYYKLADHLDMLNR